MTEHPRKWTRRVDALVLQATDPHSGRAQRNGAIQLLRRMAELADAAEEIRKLADTTLDRLLSAR